MTEESAAMTLFLPRMFTAENGAVFFDGRFVPIGKAIDAREYALRQAMNLKASTRTQAMWEAVFHSARLAIDAARNQRRAAIRVVQSKNGNGLRGNRWT